MFRTLLNIVDINYAVVCASLKPSGNLLILSLTAEQTSYFDYVIPADNRLQINVVLNKHAL